MSHRNRNRFKKPKGSPFDHNGPSHASLRRSLEWLETHGPDAPVSVELPRESEEIPAASEEIPSEPAEQSAPEESAPQESAPPQTEPPPESEPAQVETAAAEAPTAAAETQPPEPETESTASNDDATGEPPTTEDDLEAAEIRSILRSPRNPLINSRRFRRPDDADPANPARHRRCCIICHHEERYAIEQAFLEWRRSNDIKYEFHLPNRMCL